MDKIVQEIVDGLPKGSWCKPKKAQRMAELILQTKPQTCVEIGVFGGDTLFVIAKALKHLGSGVVYGIDPWSKEAALEGMVSEGTEEETKNYKWWSGLNYETLYRKVSVYIAGKMLRDHCKLIRTRAREPNTLAIFEDRSVNFLHFDGNHGLPAVNDAKLWERKCAPGCILFHDDVSWVEGGEMHNALAFEWFMACGFEVLEEMIEDCAIMIKRN